VGFVKTILPLFSEECFYYLPFSQPAVCAKLEFAGTCLALPPFSDISSGMALDMSLDQGIRVGAWKERRDGNTQASTLAHAGGSAVFRTERARQRQERALQEATVAEESTPIMERFCPEPDKSARLSRERIRNPAFGTRFEDPGTCVARQPPPPAAVCPASDPIGKHLIGKRKFPVDGIRCAGDSGDGQLAGRAAAPRFYAVMMERRLRATSAWARMEERLRRPGCVTSCAVIVAMMRR
jgi:hypothetical protein